MVARRWVEVAILLSVSALVASAVALGVLMTPSASDHAEGAFISFFLVLLIIGWSVILVSPRPREPQVRVRARASVRPKGP